MTTGENIYEIFTMLFNLSNDSKHIYLIGEFLTLVALARATIPPLRT